MSDSKTLYVMQGIPGSGKSTIAKMIRAQTGGVILSTDDYWYEVTDTHGQTYRGDKYNFDQFKLGEAHLWNQRRALECMQEANSNPVVIIDNTNIKKSDAEAYMTFARLFNYEIQVVRIQVPVRVAVARQANRPLDRQIPEDVISRMSLAMEDLA